MQICPSTTLKRGMGNVTKYIPAEDALYYFGVKFVSKYASRSKLKNVLFELFLITVSKRPLLLLQSTRHPSCLWIQYCQ
jgi:hypothetical protein